MCGLKGKEEILNKTKKPNASEHNNKTKKTPNASEQKKNKKKT